MRANYQNRNYTSRSTKITQEQIEKLRATQLAKTKSVDKAKFIKSKKFDSLLKRQVKINRAKQSQKIFEDIQQNLNLSSGGKSGFSEIFKERTKRNSAGKVVKVNSFSSASYNKKLKVIRKQVKKGTFNVKRYVARADKYKENKKYLPDNASTNEILGSLERTNFYYEQRELITKFNKTPASRRKNSAVAKQLRNLWSDEKNKAIDNFTDL